MPKKKNQSKTKSGKKRRVTSYDVAKDAGVSASAVSRCFKPGASVSKKMRTRVMRSARMLGYQPNAIARSLITQRTNIVAVTTSWQTNLYYPEVLLLLSRRFADKGIRILLFTLDDESDIDELFDQVFQYQLDGVVEAAVLSEDQINLMESREIPVIFYNQSLTDRLVNSVCCDQSAGERRLVGRLVDAGHKSFGLLTGPESSSKNLERMKGARDRLRECGIKTVTSVSADYSYEGGANGLLELHGKLNGLPDAIVCENDIMAIGCIDAVRNRLKKKVPEDVSIVGFDGVGPGQWENYDLTTIRQPIYVMSEAVVSMMQDRIERPELPSEKRVFSGILVEGGSAKLS